MKRLVLIRRKKSRECRRRKTREWYIFNYFCWSWRFKFVIRLHSKQMVRGTLTQRNISWPRTSIWKICFSDKFSLFPVQVCRRATQHPTSSCSSEKSEGGERTRTESSWGEHRAGRGEGSKVSLPFPFLSCKSVQERWKIRTFTSRGVCIRKTARTDILSIFFLMLCRYEMAREKLAEARCFSKSILLCHFVRSIYWKIRIAFSRGPSDEVYIWFVVSFELLEQEQVLALQQIRDLDVKVEVNPDRS